MAKYRKKIETIDAEQWFMGKDIDGVCECPNPNKYKGASVGPRPPHVHSSDHDDTIPTMLHEGDWVITYFDGSKGMCDNTTFGMYYEPMEEEE